MLRKTLTTLSLIGLLLSVGAWGVSEVLRGIPWAWYYSGPPGIITRGPQAWIVISALLFGSTFCLCRPFRHHRRRQRKKLGLCLGCGYNLRGLIELRCPECNTPFEKCSAKP